LIVAQWPQATYSNLMEIVASASLVVGGTVLGQEARMNRALSI
jgi:hypothetical protein